MARKHPRDLECGMILAEEVLNLDGHTLFTEGLSLTARHIEILQMWGIPSVEIAGGESERGPVEIGQFSHAVVDLAETQTNERFRLVRSAHPAVETARNIAVLEAAKKIQEIEGRS